MIFLDTSFFVALAVEKDEHHQRAHEIKQSVAEYGESITASDHIIDELFTLLVRKGWSSKLSLLAQDLLSIYNIEILFSEKEDIMPSVENMLKFGFSSYADGLSVTLMRKKGMKKIVSFDADFDRVPGIRRIS